MRTILIGWTFILLMVSCNNASEKTLESNAVSSALTIIGFPPKSFVFLLGIRLLLALAGITAIGFVFTIPNT